MTSKNAGDFEAVAVAIRPLLLRRAAGIMQGAAEPEDVVQQALLDCFRYLPTFDGSVQLSTWITGMVELRAWNAVRDVTRRLSSLPAEVVEDDEGEEEKVEPSYEEPYDIVVDLKKGIDTLPEFQREVLLAVHVEGYSTYEYAKKLGVNVGKVRCNLEAAIKSMRHYLEDYEEEHAGLMASEAA